METPSNENITILRKRRRMESEDFWKKHAEKLEESNLTRKEYCRLNALNYDRFGYWLHRWSQKSASFVPIKLKSIEETPQNSAVKTLCSIALSNKHILKIHDFSVLQVILEKLG